MGWLFPVTVYGCKYPSGYERGSVGRYCANRFMGIGIQDSPTMGIIRFRNYRLGLCPSGNFPPRFRYVCRLLALRVVVRSRPPRVRASLGPTVQRTSAHHRSTFSSPRVAPPGKSAPPMKEATPSKSAHEETPHRMRIATFAPTRRSLTPSGVDDTSASHTGRLRIIGKDSIPQSYYSGPSDTYSPCSNAARCLFLYALFERWAICTSSSASRIG